MGHERDSGMESTKSHSYPPAGRGAQHSAINIAGGLAVVDISGTNEGVSPMRACH